MRGGHNIVPTAEKEKRGTSRKDRDEGRVENTAIPLKSIPKPPANFDEIHRKKWVDICSRVFELGILTAQDYDALASYVKHWVIAETAWKDVLENGQTLWIETANGQKPITNPSLTQFNEAENNMKRLYSEFGLTPRARMGIRTSPSKKDETDPLTAIFGKN